MSNVAKIAQISLCNARHCLETKNYGRAFSNYLLFLKLKSDESHSVFTEFALASKEWFEQLEEERRFEDLFKSYDQACVLFPNHEVVYNNIGAQLFRLGYVQEAAAYIRKSLLISPDYLAARDNLENICSHLVERWHFAMLNDRKRNKSYRFAIHKAIKSGYNSVLDIGTGTGILSLMCSSAGAHHITACDSSQAMIDVARDVLLANGAQNKVHLLHKHSTALQLPTDIPERVKLVVTETFDAGLFGEHIVSTLVHAWKNLLSTSPTGTVIPCGATVYVCGIECDTIRAKTRLLYPVLQHIDLGCVNLVCSTGRVGEEPYTTENLANICGGYKILTNISELLRVSFCNLCDLESLHKGKDWICELFLRRQGRLDALAVWFDLHLDDTITIGTGADSQSCWEQAIYPVSAVHLTGDPDHENYHVRKKDKLVTKFHFEQDCLRLTKCDLVLSQPQNVVTKPTAGTSASADNSSCHGDTETGSGVSVRECSMNNLPFRKRKVENDCQGIPNSKTAENYGECSEPENKTDYKENDKLFKVEHETCSSQLKHGSFVNNPEGNATYQTDKAGTHDITFTQSSDVQMEGDGNDVLFDMSKCSLKSSYNISQKLEFVTETSEIEYVNDIHLNKQYCHVLEKFVSDSEKKDISLLYITPRLSFLGIQAVKMGFKSVTMVTIEEHFPIIQQVAGVNGCEKGSVCLAELSALQELEMQADLVVCDLVDPCGAFRQQALEDLIFHKITSLAPSGKVLPVEVKIHGLFIESEELENLSHVTGNDKTLDFRIAEFINVFQMQNHLNIDLTTLNYTKLTDVTELLSIDLASITVETGPEVLDLNVERSTEVIASGKVTALVYWFEMRLDKDTVVNTLDARCHWKQAGIMIKDDLVVGHSQTLVAKVVLQNSCLDVKIIKPEHTNGH
ncbi:protein arginine N-methyltransferase 9-like [Mya arenaria]|uniref:protein arginine N-methyltransferase 9-like n=1 Tax=Mya arenaria TaxID=6604 RepID=UPI0022E74354|nr:protein arginine N-methyltransferase 9-like [Mya arenaria]